MKHLCRGRCEIVTSSSPAAKHAGERAEYTLRYLVHASPKAVFEVLTDARQITRYTRAPAVSEARAGGKYEAFDGSIQGEFVACSEVRMVPC